MQPIAASEQADIIVYIKYPQTEMFADALIVKGYRVHKVYYSGELRDEYSIMVQEIIPRAKAVLIDSVESNYLVRFCPIHNAIFVFLDLKVDKANDELRLMDYYTLEVKDASNKTRDDWEEAAVLFGEWISKSSGSVPNL